MEVSIVAALNQLPGVGEFCYLNSAPEDQDLPYCRFFQVASVPVSDLSGVSGQKRHRYQFDFFAASAALARDWRDQVANKLNQEFSVVAALERSTVDDQNVHHYVLDVTMWQ